MAVEFIKIIPLTEGGFGLQAAKDIAVQGLTGSSEDELLESLARHFNDMPPDVQIDVERPDRSHIKLSRDRAPS
jgi:hypothetical protein